MNLPKGIVPHTPDIDSLQFGLLAECWTHLRCSRSPNFGGTLVHTMCFHTEGTFMCFQRMSPLGTHTKTFPTKRGWCRQWPPPLSRLQTRLDWRTSCELCVVCTPGVSVRSAAGPVGDRIILRERAARKRVGPACRLIRRAPPFFSTHFFATSFATTGEAQDHVSLLVPLLPFVLNV